jgi:hypothetical protein
MIIIIICQGALPNMPQTANLADYTTYDPASNLLAYLAVKAAICQRWPQPLHELPTRIAKSAGSGEPSLHRWMRYCIDRTGNFETAIFLRGKKGVATFSLGLIYHSMALS